MSDTAAVVLVAVVVVCVVAIALLLPRPVSKSVLGDRMRSRVIVTLKSGASFDGVLFSADDRVWVLRDVAALGAGDRGSNVPVDGEVLVMVADIEYCQKP